MMCAHLLKPEPPPDQRGWFYNKSEKVFDGMLRFYDKGVKWVLVHQRTTLIATILTVALTVVLAIFVPKGFFPQQDTGLIVAVTEAPADMSFTRMLDLQQEVTLAVLEDPAVESVGSFIGSDGTNPTANSGRLSITLKPLKERKASADVVIGRLTNKVARVPDMSVYFQSVQDLQIDTSVSRTQYQFTLEDADADELDKWAPQMVEAMRKLPQLADVASDRQLGGRQLHMTIDRDTASRLGITPQAIDDTLYDAFGQRQVSTIFTQLNLYRVILEMKPGVAHDQRARSIASTCTRAPARRKRSTPPPGPADACRQR